MSPVAPSESAFFQTPSHDNVTLRQIVYTHIGGDRLRITVSNLYGEQDLRIAAAGVAIHSEGSAVMAESVRPVTFSGQPQINVPPGAAVLSDPVALDVRPFTNLAVSLYLPDSNASPTFHAGAEQTSYVSEAGNHVTDIELPVAEEVDSWSYLIGLEIAAPAGLRAVVAFGDSITDGLGSTPNSNHRWPDFLASRLAESGDATTAVINSGISGNRVLHDVMGQNALARFERDALSWPGVTHIIVLEGTNDIGFSAIPNSPFGEQAAVSADEIISGHRQLIARAHARGITILGATLIPFNGAGYYSAAGELKRVAVNEWIRTSEEYDGVIDFDLATQDPDDATKMRADLHSGDWLHPNDAGYEAMAAAIDLSLFD